MDKNSIDKGKIFKAIKNFENKLITMSGTHRDSYLEKINQYLKLFNPNLKLGQLSQHSHRVIYTLQVNGHSLRTDEKFIYSLRYSLSE